MAASRLVLLRAGLSKDADSRDSSSPELFVTRGISLSPGCGATFGDSANIFAGDIEIIRLRLKEKACSVVEDETENDFV